jgi:hypothetical protein
MSLQGEVIARLLNLPVLPDAEPAQPATTSTGESRSAAG